MHHSPSPHTPCLPPAIFRQGLTAGSEPSVDMVIVFDHLSADDPFQNPVNAPAAVGNFQPRRIVEGAHFLFAGVK